VCVVVVRVDRPTLSTAIGGRVGIRGAGGDHDRYSFGDDPAMLGDYGWYSGNSGSQAHPVGEKKPNAFGIYDMQGNVWQWVEDCYHEDYKGAPENGSAWKQDADCSTRVVRGGSWGSNPEILRSASRFGNPSFGRYFTLGFRVGRTLITP